MEEEFIRNQERLKPQEEKIEVICFIYIYIKDMLVCSIII